MAIITLTTDLGLKDHYVAAVKGEILRQLPDVTIVDISHQVPTFNIQQAAYILKNAYPHFPDGTVHIIGVNAELSAQTPHIALQVSGQYFIGADNGIFSFLFDRIPDKIVELNIKQETELMTFPTKDIFTKAACHLARGGTLEIIGTPLENFREVSYFRPAIDNDSIRGNAMYIDSYHNIVFNISQQLFREVGKGRPFTIYFRHLTLNSFNRNYNEVPAGEVLALFNSAGYLEIAQNQGFLAKSENVQLNEMITIQFE
jgi:S-adenosylmethionine hydrolase